MRSESGVYVMAVPEHPEWGVKVGRVETSSVRSRAKSVAGSLPVDVAVLAFELTTLSAECEQWLHIKLADHRWRGEWFQIEKDGPWGVWLRALVEEWRDHNEAIRDWENELPISLDDVDVLISLDDP